ncbi:TetR/AcrR family transcriptional regulator [Pseudonocardia bannensis]|uniref:TetR/AcrR family transcriptional regulator n=1 Tax=Pseudonocardia bannensis TaxID=630973 RepID=A0A848DLJ0_9PSEU|nr:TetR/AcrR family transcriptional regulator [Pseudonocardia bannensis]NMH93582.1 TetR/AcrR family transcriptional regulator [Pseudonocardia bannensis]
MTEGKRRGTRSRGGGDLTATDQQPASPARRAGARRAELIALASRLFRERGYHGVGMRAIAEAADMQAASLYHHFRNKEELLLEAIFVVDRDLIVDQLPILDGPGSHRERLTRLVRGHVLHIGDNRDAWWVASRELRALSPERLDAVQVYRRRYQHRIAEFIADGVRAGEFDCDDPRLATLAVLDMINGLNEWYSTSGRLSITELADRYSVMVLRQLGAP